MDREHRIGRAQQHTLIGDDSVVNLRTHPQDGYHNLPCTPRAVRPPSPSEHPALARVDVIWFGLVAFCSVLQQLLSLVAWFALGVVLWRDQQWRVAGGAPAGAP